MRGAGHRRWWAAGLALAFVAGLGGEAWSAHHGHHHAGPAPAGGPVTIHVHGATPTDGTTHPDDPEPRPCTCVGVCHGTAATPLPSPALQLPCSRGKVATQLATRPHTPPRSPSPYLLPYPNGPPL